MACFAALTIIAKLICPLIAAFMAKNEMGVGMVKTWASSRVEDDVCDKCGSVYEVTMHRFPHRDKDSFNCSVCGNLMREWNDTHCPMFELKQKGQLPPDHQA